MIVLNSSCEAAVEY